LECQNNKAAGLDHIPTELLKNGGDEMIKGLTNITNINNQDTRRMEDLVGVITVLPKKGNLSDCNTGEE